MLERVAWLRDYTNKYRELCGGILSYTRKKRKKRARESLRF